MSLELWDLGGNGKKVYILLNPGRPPYIIHSRSPSWNRASIEILLGGFRIFKRAVNAYLETSGPAIIVCGSGYSIYTPGRSLDKLRGGVLKYILVRSMLDGSLDGAGHKNIEISIKGLNHDLLRALIMSLKPIILIAGWDEAENLLRSIGVKIFYPERLYRFHRLKRYLMKEYRLSHGLHEWLSQKLDALYGGRRLSICIGMYSQDCDLAVLVDELSLQNVNHLIINPVEDKLSLKLFI